jgi:tRNA(His) 5'-end guanylyltransferase
MVRDDLGTRMKEYEKRNRYYLQRRTPVIIRLDMKAGHAFTKGFQRPFDELFIKSMQETAKYLCENVQNCKLSYQQSDEITLVLIDYKKLNIDSWFDYRVDKLCSIAASMATMAFNKFFEQNVYDDNPLGSVNSENCELINTYINAIKKGAMFDARCFNIPKEEVTNNLYWRQLDASRNSIQMVGQANFSQKELQNKSCNIIQDMLFTQKEINWNDLPTYQKRGSCCIKEYYQSEEVDIKDGACIRSRWIIDKEIPIFKGEGRNYIEKLISFKENENEIL